MRVESEETVVDDDLNAEAVRWLETRAPLVMHRHVVASCMRQFAAQAIAADRRKGVKRPADLIAEAKSFYQDNAELLGEEGGIAVLMASFAQWQVDKTIAENDRLREALRTICYGHDSRDTITEICEKALEGK